MIDLSYIKLIKSHKVNQGELPDDLKKDVSKLDDLVTEYSINEKDEIKNEISDLDSSVSKRLNEWLDEDIPDENEVSDDSDEEGFTEESEMDELKGILDKNYRISIKDLRIMLGRKPKYPMEKIGEIKLVKILFKPYYEVRNIEKLK